MTAGFLVVAEGLGRDPQRIAVAATLLFLVFVIELVRRRRLIERYALLWMAAAVALVVLAVWDGGLDWIADALGILSPPNALFLLGLATVVALALNFSVAISRLSEEAKILAQEVARLDGEQRRLRGNRSTNGGPPDETGRSQIKEEVDDAASGREPTDDAEVRPPGPSAGA